MKTLKTTGSFMLICPETRVVFDPEVPTKVERVSDFMKDRIESGDLVEAEAKDAKVAEIAGTDNVKAALAAAPKKKGK